MIASISSILDTLAVHPAPVHPAATNAAEPDQFWTAIIAALLAALIGLTGTILTIWAAGRTLSRQLSAQADARAKDQRAEWDQRRREQNDEWVRQRAEKADERASIARAIGEEVSLIAAQIVGHHAMRASLTERNPPVELTTPMFDAVGERIGELEGAREIAMFYTKVRLVMRLLQDWASTNERLETNHEGNRGNSLALQVRLRQFHAGYFKMSRDVIASAEALIPKLQEQITQGPQLKVIRLPDSPHT